MLTLTRRKGERLNIGLSVEITVLEISSGRVRLGITAPRRLQVHRGEIISRMELANKSALSRGEASLQSARCVLTFPEGLIGLPEHKELLLCETTDDSGMHVLVSKNDPCVQLAVVEAERVMPDYPVLEARAAAGLEHEEAATALVVTLGQGETTASVNLQAPVVIGLQSLRGMQVVLWREDLALRHPLELPLPSLSPIKVAAAGG